MSQRVDAHRAQHVERRQWHRVRLSVPVQFGKVTAKRTGEVCPCTGHSADLSTAGAYVLTGAHRRYASGETLTVSIAIPPASRQVFPFTHLLGSARVIRVERLSSADADRRMGLALSFNQAGMTMLGATLEIPGTPIS